MGLVRTYGLVYAVELRQSDDALAEYVAKGVNYRPYARKLGARDAVFLTKAADPVEVEQATIMSDRQLARVWRLHPEYEAPDEDALIGDPGEWATGAVGEVVIRDPGGDRKSVLAGKRVPVCVASGGRRLIKKKKRTPP